MNYRKPGRMPGSVRAVIDGKTYNSASAIEIASVGGGTDWGNFRTSRETLYRTPKGAFFIVGEGHALTRWAHHYGDMRGVGHGVDVLTETEAREWLERHGSTEDYERVFGLPDEA